VSIHLRPSAPIAADALLPGDPGRALLLAQALLAKPRMSNHHRGLWGYYGETREGRPLTIQSTGIGGPSAAAVVHELAGLGVRRAIRVGTCGALNGELGLGRLVIASRAIGADGTSSALGSPGEVSPDAELTRSLERAAAPSDPLIATVATSDLFYEEDGPSGGSWSEAGAQVVEMEAAPLFALGDRLGLAVACALVVSDLLDGRRERIDDEQLAVAAERMGRIAAAAFG
jgi:uridine phosphorylase